MKRKELWELLGEVPADMIEEASIPRKGNRVLWFLLRKKPLSEAAGLRHCSGWTVGFCAFGFPCGRLTCPKAGEIRVYQVSRK